LPQSAQRIGRKGIMEYWNNGRSGGGTIGLLISPFDLIIIPLFQHSSFFSVLSVSSVAKKFLEINHAL
jgi:hypothetical protein